MKKNQFVIFMNDRKQMKIVIWSYMELQINNTFFVIQENKILTDELE